VTKGFQGLLLQSSAAKGVSEALLRAAFAWQLSFGMVCGG